MSLVPCATLDKCRLLQSASMTTCVNFPPVYDNTGKNLNPDMNSTSSTITCIACGKVFDVQVCNGERTVKERK